jgi:hypothetical protein
MSAGLHCGLHKPFYPRDPATRIYAEPSHTTAVYVPMRKDSVKPQTLRNSLCHAPASNPLILSPLQWPTGLHVPLGGSGGGRGLSFLCLFRFVCFLITHAKGACIFASSFSGLRWLSDIHARCPLAWVLLAEVRVSSGSQLPSVSLAWLIPVRAAAFRVRTSRWRVRCSGIPLEPAPHTDRLLDLLMHVSDGIRYWI